MQTGSLIGVIARSGATKQSQGRVVERARRLPRLPFATLGEWLAMTGCGVLEARSLDSRFRGNDMRGCEGLVPAGVWGFSCPHLHPLPSGQRESRPTTGVCRGAKPLCRGFGGVPQFRIGIIARSGATKQSRGGFAVARRTRGLPRLLPTRLGEWLAMIGCGVLEARSLDSRFRGNDTRGCEGLVPAGCLRVSLSFLFLSPKSGGQGLSTRLRLSRKR